MSKNFIYGGYIVYPGVGKISDEDVYKLILNHSRFIDRLRKSKMVEMSLLGQCILMGIFEDVDPNDLLWKFYGKHSDIIRKVNGCDVKNPDYIKASTFGA